MPPRPVVLALALAATCGIWSSARGPVQLDRGLRPDGAPPASVIETLGGAMPIVVSLVLLVAALWVILSRRYTPNDRHWGYGTIGTVIGFWLHT